MRSMKIYDEDKNNPIQCEALTKKGNRCKIK